MLPCPQCGVDVDLDAFPSHTRAVCAKCGCLVWLQPRLDKAAVDLMFSAKGGKGPHVKAGPVQPVQTPQGRNPRAAHQYNHQGVFLSRKKLFRQAISEFNEAIAQDPLWVQAYNNRGYALAVCQEHDQALADFNKALE